MNILMNAGNIGQIRAKRTQGGHIVRPQMHMPTEFALQNTGEPPRNADVAEIIDDLAKNPTDKRRSIHRNNGNKLKRAEIVEQIHNQQNNRNKQQHGLTFQIKLLFQMMLDGVERTNLNKNVASQARMMPLIRCWGLSSGGLATKTASVAKGMRQTTSQRTSRFRDIARLSKKQNAIIAPSARLV